MLPACRAGWMLLLAAAVSLGGCWRVDVSKRLIVILVPSEDNPFFKAEGDFYPQTPAANSWMRCLESYSLNRRTSGLLTLTGTLHGLLRFRSPYLIAIGPNTMVRASPWLRCPFAT